MATILLVDDDLGLQKILGIALQKYQDEFTVLFAGNGEEAIEIFGQQRIDLLVTDIKMPKMDGLALLAHMSVKFPNIPCIVLTSYSIPGLEQKLSRSIFRFLKKPVDPTKLAGLIREGLEQAEGGEALSGISVPGLMQIIEAEEKTCLLVIHIDGVKQGGMYFNRGELYDAICGTLQHEEAALKLIAMDNAQVEYRKSPPEKISRGIKSGMQALILEAMRLKDEAMAEEEGGEGSHERDTLLTQGIQLCEGLHLREAQKILLQVASKDETNMAAWLWLSRTVANMKQLRVALTRAYKLNPKNKEAVQDVRKFSLAGKAGLDRVRHCPFCYAPIDPKSSHCHYCNGYLTVNAENLPKIGQAINRQSFQATLSRFEDVLARELNLPVLFYAALACLHLGDFDAALEYLEQLQQCVDPSENRYGATVERIVAFIASRQVTEEAGDSSPGAEAVAVTGASAAQKKVLVVEDSPTTRKVIKMTLERHNLYVVEAEDGVEALTKINDENPDLILLDVMLPKLDGYGILSVLKQNPQLKGVPVIMLTSKDGLKDRIKGRFSSASAYLTKPFKPGTLMEKVNQYIG
jgi:twitching motility two-component system response regulator PilG